MEILLATISVALLGYSVTMPQIDNAKYTLMIHENKFIIMNTQNGKMISCEKIEDCEKALMERLK